MFVRGLPNLILCVDHNPLIAIFGADQPLEDIHNPRLLNYKLKSVRYRFSVHHIPGKKNFIPDTMFRRSDSPIMNTPPGFLWTGLHSLMYPLKAQLGPSTHHGVHHPLNRDMMMAEVNSWSNINGISAECRPQAVSWPWLEST